MWLIVEMGLIGMFASRADWLVPLSHVASSQSGSSPEPLPLASVGGANVESAGWVRSPPRRQKAQGKALKSAHKLYIFITLLYIPPCLVWIFKLLPSI